MITNTGKEIIGKYLLGQAPAYASFIAIGCGAKPLATAPNPLDYAAKQNLDFEMFRVPISSRGFVNEGGTEKLVLTAELPTEERYEISEVGVYSAGSNPSAGAFDSKTVFTFAGGENWQYHTSAASPIPTITTPLDTNNDNIISTTDKVFQTNADNSIFYNTTRAERYERCRFLNNVILIRGDDSNLIRKTATISNISTSSGIITYTTSANHNFASGDIVSITGVNPSQYDLSNVTILNTPTSNSFRVTNPATGAYVSGGSATADHLSIEAGSNHIHLTGLDVNFTRNSVLDELRLAFSLVTKDNSGAVPDAIRILITFASTDDEENPGQFASFEVDIDNGGDYDFATNRYIVITKTLEELYQSSGFTWNAVTVAKIYACVIDDGAPSDNYYIALDALRLENTQTTNPLYGLTGYSVVVDPNETTIIKSPNTSNYIEFRFSVGVT